MQKLNNARMQAHLLKIPHVTINHTRTHTIVSSRDYAVHIKNIRTDEKAPSHKVLWDEGKHYSPLNLEHLGVRYMVSKALGDADEQR